MSKNFAVGVVLLSASTAIAAPQLPPEAPPPGPLVIPLNAVGEIERPGKPSVSTAGMKEFMAEKFASMKRDAEKRGGRMDTGIKLSVSPDAPYRAVIAVMDAARAAGFVEVSMEAPKQ